jgi:hypothetical protein
MNRSPSFFASLAGPTLKGPQLILYISSCVTQILRSSRGRYKLFGVVQYLAALYKDCMLDYLHLYRIKEWPRKVRSSKTLQDSMKNGRKVFRLLRWIEEVGSIDKNLRKAHDWVSSLKFLRHLVGIFYYLFDNILWVAEAGVINKYISDPRWKWETARNVLSLIRYSLLICIALLKTQGIIYKERGSVKDMLSRNLRISTGNEGYDSMLNLLKVRFKRRSNMLSLMKNILRILMLYRAAKLPGSVQFSMIFHDICGVCSYCLGVAKLFANNEQPEKQKLRTIKPPALHERSLSEN